jgi:tape measure domain-containing protein
MADTSETLKLEIEVAAREAREEVRGMSTEVKALAADAKALAPSTREVKSVLADLASDLKKNETAARLFGDELGGLKNRQALLRGAMVDLIDQGITPETREIQDLKLEYDAATTASREMEQQNRVMTGSISDLQGALGSIAAVKIFQTIGTATLDAGKVAIETAGRYEMLQANFETLTGSTAAAAAEFKSLRQFANVTPFSLEGTAAAAQQLQAAKTPIADLTTRLGQLGDLSLGNQQKFESMVGSFSKMSVKGKVDLEQMNVFMEAGVPILDALATGYGKTESAVFEMMSKGEVSTSDFIAAMQRMTSEGGQFFGGMARGAQTWEGMWSTYKDSLDGVAASYGQLLLPAAKAIIGVMTSMNSAISDSPILQGILAGALVTAVVLIGIWAIKMAAATAATWLHYAATMALNAAKAVGNPILIAGIVAVGLATAGYIAYAASQNKSTDATKESTSQTKSASSALRDTAAAAKEAEDATKSYQHELDITTRKELEAMKTSMEWLKTQASKTGSGGWTTSMEASLQAIGKELEERKKSFDDLNKKAAAFKASWASEYGKYQASQSGDPYAGLEYERKGKLDDATTAGIGPANQKVIDEINAYYDEKRTKLAKDLSKKEIEEAAKVADARIAEAQRVAAETLKINATLFDQANESRAIDAKYTETKIDDLQLERDRTLTLFTGTEEQKLAIAKYYAREIADARLDAAKKEYEKEKNYYANKMEDAEATGNVGEYTSAAIGNAVQNTEVGSVAGLGGSNPWIALVSIVLKVVTSLESFQKVMNGISSLIKVAGDLQESILNPAIDETLSVLIDMFEEIGKVGQPITSSSMTLLKLITAVLSITVLPSLKLAGKAFTWLNDSVIVPFGNKIIDVINGVIKLVNKLPGIDIDRLAHLQTSSEIADSEARIADKVEAVSDSMDDVREIFDSRKEDLDSAYQENVESLENLLKLGAISESSYASRMASTTSTYNASVDALESQEEAQLDALQDILDALNEGNEISDAALHAAGVAGYAVGAVEIPQTQLAIVHKKETIVPASFSEGLRRGELTLSKSGSSGSTLNQITVEVKGNIIGDDDYADKLATTIERRQARGQREKT